MGRPSASRSRQMWRSIQKMGKVWPQSGHWPSLPGISWVTYVPVGKILRKFSPLFIGLRCFLALRGSFWLSCWLVARVKGCEALVWGVCRIGAARFSRPERRARCRFSAFAGRWAGFSAAGRGAMRGDVLNMLIEPLEAVFCSTLAPTGCPQGHLKGLSGRSGLR
jgi:hypothetical protein